jgi:hypothetical protein
VDCQVTLPWGSCPCAGRTIPRFHHVVCDYFHARRAAQNLRKFANQGTRPNARFGSDSAEKPRPRCGRFTPDNGRGVAAPRTAVCQDLPWPPSACLRK